MRAAWSRDREGLSKAIRGVFPSGLRAFSEEPAFRWDETSFGYFLVDEAAGWVRANDLAGYPEESTGEIELLAHVTGTAADYAGFASDYYETEVREDLVAEVFALKAITPGLVDALNPATSWEEIAGELYGEIGYPLGDGV